MRRRSGRRCDDGGFTLVELLAVVTILGIIGFALTESVILGFKTTDATAEDMSRSVAIQAVQSFFTRDVLNARRVSKLAPAPSCTIAPAESAGLFLHLSPVDTGNAGDVWYTLRADSPSIAGRGELVRLSCAPDGSTDSHELGRLAFDPAGAQPELARCDGNGDGIDEACPASLSGFVTVTLKVPTNRPEEVATTAVSPTTVAPAPTPTWASVDLRVRRRTT